jgi:hypothetical protein
VAWIIRLRHRWAVVTGGSPDSIRVRTYLGCEGAGHSLGGESLYS